VYLILGAVTWRCAIIVRKKFTRAVWLRVVLKISSFSCRILLLPVCQQASNGKKQYQCTNKHVMKKLLKNSMKSIYPYIYIRWSLSFFFHFLLFISFFAFKTTISLQDIKFYFCLSSLFPLKSIGFWINQFFFLSNFRMMILKHVVHHIIQILILKIFVYVKFLKIFILFLFINVNRLLILNRN